MSLGDLVISLSADTARFQNDMGKAAQSVDKWANIVVKNSQQAENYIRKMSEAGVASVDRLQREFNSLGVSTAKSIEGAAFSSIAAFVKIKESGVAAFGEIERAESAARAKLSQLPGVLDTSGAGVGRLTASFSEMGKTAIAKLEQMKEKAHRDFVAMQMSGEASASALNASFSHFQGAEQAVRNLRQELELVNAEMSQMVTAQSLANSFKGLGIRSNSEIDKDKQSAIDSYNSIRNSGADPNEIARAYTAMQDTLQRLEKETLTVAQKAAADRVLATNKEVADREIAYARLFDEAYLNERKGVIETEKAIAAKLDAELKMYDEAVKLDGLRTQSIKRNLAEQAAAFERFKANEKASYAAQGMQGDSAAGKLIGQNSAGPNFATQLKAQMEQASAASQLMAQEMASYAASAMQGEFAAAKLVGQIQAGSNFAAQLKAQMEGVTRESEAAAEASKKNSKAIADANAYAMRNQGATSDRLQDSFDKLGIKSSLNIESEKAKVIAAFNQIKNSGVASASEIKQAMKAMKTQLEEIEKVGSGNVMKGHEHGISLLSLASVAAIAKVQIMYSLINQTMSLIGSLPKTAIDAIETFQSSMVKNAAVITSMQGGVKDIGKAYLENRQYAEAVQNVLVKMDAHTIASYSQLQLMNDAFVQQGVYIDINNKKQLEGYQNVANALATISAGMSNPDMQFSQEIRGLMNGEDKPTNMLFRTLKAIDPMLKEHLADWKRIASETGNAGYVLEKLGPLLQGFAAASGDIDSLWATVKSTMSTIRDEVLRGGLSQGFGEIVSQMKEINKYAEQNKEKIQAFLRNGFDNTKVAATYMWNLGKAVAYLAEPAMWITISAGIIKVAGSMTALTTQITLATAGINLLVAGLIAAATYGGKKFLDDKSLSMDARDVRDSAVGGKGIGSSELAKQKAAVSGFDADAMRQVRERFPLMDNENIAILIRNNGIELETMVDEEYGRIWTKVNFNDQKIKFIQDSMVESVKQPKAPKGGSETTDLKENQTKANNLYLAYSKAFDERVATQTIIKNKNEIERNQQHYDRGVIDLKSYLEKRKELTQASLQAEVDAKTSELIEAQKLQAKAYSEQIKNKKGVRNFDAENNARVAADTKEENAQKALALAVAAMNDAKLKAGADEIKINESVLRGYQEQQAVFLEMKNDFVGAAAIRKQLSISDLNYLQLQANALAGNKEAIAALAAANSVLANNTDVATFQQTKVYKELEIQILELTDQYEKAAKARAALEQSSPEFKRLSPEEQAQRKIISNNSITEGARKDKEGGLNTKEIMQSTPNFFGMVDESAIAQTAFDKLKVVYNEKLEFLKKNAGEESQVYKDKQAEIEALENKHNWQIVQTEKEKWEAVSNTIGTNLKAIGNVLMQGNKEQFERGKKIAMAMATLDTFTAASAAFAQGSKINIYVGIASMAAAVAAGLQNVAMIDSQTYQAREFGGPVTAGQSYIVGEKRAELFTPGASGTITPFVPKGGGNDVSVTNVYQISTGVADTVRAEVGRLIPMITQYSVNAVTQAINSGGELSAAVGRR